MGRRLQWKSTAHPISWAVRSSRLAPRYSSIASYDTLDGVSRALLTGNGSVARSCIGCQSDPNLLCSIKPQVETPSLSLRSASVTATLTLCQVQVEANSTFDSSTNTIYLILIRIFNMNINIHIRYFRNKFPINIRISLSYIYIYIYINIYI